MFGTHHTICTTVRLTKNNRYFRNGSLAVCEQQLSTVNNNTAVFLTCTRQEARNIHQSYDRNIERIAETNETCCLTRCIDIQYPGKIFRLICDNTYRLSVKTSKTGNDIGSVQFLRFKELSVVNDGIDHFQYIIRFIRIIRNDFVQRVFQTVDSICANSQRSIFQIILRQETQ